MADLPLSIDVLAAVHHPVRRRIVEHLVIEGPSQVGVMAAAFGEQVGSISHHLRMLERVGVVQRAPELAMDGRTSWCGPATSRPTRVPRRRWSGWATWAAPRSAGKSWRPGASARVRRSTPSPSLPSPGSSWCGCDRDTRLPRTAAEPPWRSIVGGFRHLREEPVTRALGVSLSGLNLFVGPAEGLGVAPRVREGGWGAGVLGLLLALLGAGAALGAMLTSLGRPRRQATLGFWWLVLQGIAMVLFVLVPLLDPRLRAL